MPDSLLFLMLFDQNFDSTSPSCEEYHSGPCCPEEPPATIDHDELLNELEEENWFDQYDEQHSNVLAYPTSPIDTRSEEDPTTMSLNSFEVEEACSPLKRKHSMYDGEDTNYTSSHSSSSSVPNSGNKKKKKLNKDTVSSSQPNATTVSITATTTTGNQQQPVVKVHNDVYVQFDKPLEEIFCQQFPIYWSSKPGTRINEHVTAMFTFHPYDGTIYKLDILQRELLIPKLKEHKLLPKKPSRPKQDSEGGIYYIQVNSQLYQLYSKYKENGKELDNTIQFNSSAPANHSSMQWIKQDNYTHRHFPTPTCQIISSFNNDDN